jgi:hypothetical protein
LYLVPIFLGIDIADAKSKNYKLPGSDEILAELIQAGGETLPSAIHKVVNSIWKNEEFPDQWKECIIVPFHKRGCNNYRGLSLLSTSCNFFEYLLLRLGPNIDEIIGDHHQRGFQHDRSDFIHLSDTREKMLVQRYTTSAIHRLQESLRFNQVGSTV